jgi:hypothetical protein
MNPLEPQTFLMVNSRYGHKIPTGVQRKRKNKMSFTILLQTKELLAQKPEALLEISMIRPI